MCAYVCATKSKRTVEILHLTLSLYNDTDNSCAKGKAGSFDNAVINLAPLKQR